MNDIVNKYYYCFVNPIYGSAETRNPTSNVFGYFKTKEEAEKKRKEYLNLTIFPPSMFTFCASKKSCFCFIC